MGRHKTLEERRAKLTAVRTELELEVRYTHTRAWWPRKLSNDKGWTWLTQITVYRVLNPETKKYRVGHIALGHIGPKTVGKELVRAEQRITK